MAEDRRKIIVSNTVDGQFYWRLVAGNGETIAVGESHTRRQDAHRAAEAAIPDVEREDEEKEFNVDPALIHDVRDQTVTDAVADTITDTSFEDVEDVQENDN